MMKALIGILVGLFLSHSTWAQYVNGYIYSDKNEPVAFASVYVKQTTVGTTSNQRGYFKLDLKPGNYVLVFKFIGYATLEKEFTLKENEKLRLDVTLEEASQELRAVDIIAETKDYAKEIMRKVRANRTTYSNNITSYACTTYIKSSIEREYNEIDSIKFSNTSNSFESFLKRESLNLIESISETYYTAPSKFQEIVLAYKDYADTKSSESSGNTVNIGMTIDYGEPVIAPTAFEGQNDYIFYTDAQSAKLDFYDNLIVFPSVSEKPLLSPIASTSNLSYSYDYLGNFYENGKKIHELSVKPIFSQEALFRGSIFIEDSTWALVSVDLSVNKAALRYCKEFNIIQNYEELEPGIYLPVKRNMVYTIKDGKTNILGETIVHHNNFTVNQDNAPTLKRMEMKRYAKDAFDKDSSYWASFRPIALKETEKKHISTSDSLFNYYHSQEYYNKIDSSYNRFRWYSPFIGFGHRNRFKGTEWYVGGVLEQVNFFGVGGYRHQLPGRFSKDFKSGKQLQTDGFIDYGFRNEDVKGELGIGYTYRPEKFLRTYVKVADNYTMVNNYASFASLLARSNFVRNRMILIKQRMEVVNGLYAELSFDYSKKLPITNLELEKWTEGFGPLNEPIVFDAYTKSEFRLDIDYIPFQKFVTKNGRKYTMGSDYPTLRFRYRKGVPRLFDSEVNFDYIELNAFDEIQAGRWGSTRWQFTAGTFANKKNLRILEHKYFRGSDQFIFSNPLNSFQLLGPTLDTPNEYVRANIMHHFNGMFLNKVPLINRLKLMEAGGAGMLLIPDSDFYHFEFFAGLERVFRIKQDLFRLGVYAVTSTNPLEKAQYTFKFGIAMLNPFSNRWDY
jgi:hypothetical protein